MQYKLSLTWAAILVASPLLWSSAIGSTTGPVTSTTPGTGTNAGWRDVAATGDIFTDNRNADGTGVIDPYANAIVLTHYPGDVTAFALRMGAGGAAGAGDTWGHVIINILGGSLGYQTSSSAITEAVIGGYYSTAVTDRTVHGNTIMTIGALGEEGPEMYGYVLTTGGGTVTGDAILNYNSGSIHVAPVGTLKRHGGVFGASYEGTVKGNSIMWFNGGSIDVDSYGNMGVYGGGYYATIEGNTSVNINGTDINCAVYGGGKGKSGQSNAIVGGSTHVNLLSGSVGKSIYGGGHERSTVEGNTLVTIHGGKANDNVYGGTASASGHINGNTTVVATDDANITGNVYGGGSSTGVIGGGTHVEISGNAVIGKSVYGGGSSYGVTKGDVSILVTGEAQIAQNVSAGFSYTTNNDSAANKIEGNSLVMLQGNDWSIGGSISGDSKTTRSGLSTVAGSRTLAFDKVDTKQVDNTLLAFDHVILQNGSIQNLVNVTELKNLAVIGNSILTDELDRADLHSFILQNSEANLTNTTTMDVALVNSENSVLNIDEHIVNIGGARAEGELKNSSMRGTDLSLARGGKLNLVTDGVTSPSLNISGDSTINLSGQSEINLVATDAAAPKMTISYTDIALTDESSINLHGDGASAPKATIGYASISLRNGGSINAFTDAASGSALDILGSDIVMGDSTTTGYVEQSTGGSISGQADKSVSMINSTVTGVGALRGIQAMNSSFHVGFGNTPGVMEWNSVHAYDSLVTAQIFSYDNAGNILLDGMNDSADEYSGGLTGNVSQYHLTADSWVSGGTRFEFNIVNGDGTQILDSLTLRDGAKFEFFNMAEGHRIHGNFMVDLDTMPELADGLVWDISHLSSDGYIEVIGTAPDPENPGNGDGGRIPNTLWSSADAVSGFAGVAMAHLNFHSTCRNIWASGLGQFDDIDTRRGRTGYKFNGAGYAVGTDSQFLDWTKGGIAFGQLYGTHTPNTGTKYYTAGKIDQVATMVTLYGRQIIDIPDEKNIIYADVYAAYGQVRNKTKRIAYYNGYQTGGKWRDEIMSGGITGTWQRAIDERTFHKVFVGVDYEHGKQSSFTEQGSGTHTHYFNGNFQNWTATVGTGIERSYLLRNNTVLTPEASVYYMGDFARRNPSAYVLYAGQAHAIKERAVSPGKHGFGTTVGARWKLDEHWNFSAYYNLEIRNDVFNQGVNATVYYSF